MCLHVSKSAVDSFQAIVLQNLSAIVNFYFMSYAIPLHLVSNNSSRTSSRITQPHREASKSHHINEHK